MKHGRGGSGLFRQFIYGCSLIILLLSGWGGGGIRVANTPSSVSASSGGTITAGSAGRGESGVRRTREASLQVGDKKYTLQWADTKAAAELRRQLPLAKTFTELHGNEKYYKLPHRLTAADEDIRKVHRGDVMLFDGRYVVVFYQEFQTTHRYTRLGYIEKTDNLGSDLGTGDVFLRMIP